MIESTIVLYIPYIILFIAYLNWKLPRLVAIEKQTTKMPWIFSFYFRPNLMNRKTLFVAICANDRGCLIFSRVPR